VDKKKTSNHIEKNTNLDRTENNRHNENARAAAAPDTDKPRINTDNL
jgi:hypothetical protein